MSKWGKCDFKELKNFQDKINKLNNMERQLFMESCAKELAARLLAKVIKRTPVGQYPSSSGKKGGTARRGWTAKTQEEAQSGGRGNATQYANSLSIRKTGNTYVVEIVNPVDYMSYLEFGHRTSNHQGWVRGRFMLTISEQELDAAAPGILENKLKKLLGECFSD